MGIEDIISPQNLPEKVRVFILDKTSQRKIEVELPYDIEISKVTNALNSQNKRDGKSINFVRYQVTRKTDSFETELDQDITLREAGVVGGDTLHLYPVFVNLTINEEQSLNWQKIASSGILGYLLGGGMVGALAGITGANVGNKKEVDTPTAQQNDSDVEKETNSPTQNDIQQIQQLIRELNQQLVEEIINGLETRITARFISILDEQKLTQKEKESLNSLIVDPIFGKPSLEPTFVTDIFVIMPFAPEFRPVYDDVIKSLATDPELNLVRGIKRGDDFFSHHNIMTEIWSAIYCSRLIIADCTGRNANVFYELGIAHTLGKPYILITQDILDVPFDIQGKQLIEYQNHHSWGE